MSFTTIQTAQKGPILTAVFTANDINLITWQLQRDLNDLLDHVASNDEIKVLVLESGVKDYFLAHLDIRPDPQPKLPLMHPDYPTLVYFPGLLQKLATLPKVTIALVEGRARGGGLDIALACDMRFGVRGSTILAPIEARVALISASYPQLVRLMGSGRAAEWLYSGHDLDGVTLERYGVLNTAFETSAAAKQHIEKYCSTIGTFPRESFAVKRHMADMMYPLSEMEKASNRFLEILQTETIAKMMSPLLELVPMEAGPVELDLSEKVLELWKP